MNNTHIYIGVPHPDSLSIVKNGGFDYGIENWNYTSPQYIWEPSRLTFSGNSTGTTSATTYQSGMTGTVGNTYKVKFFLKVVSAGIMNMTYGGQSFNYTTTGWKEQLITVTSGGDIISFTKNNPLEGYIDAISIIRYGGYSTPIWREIDIINDEEIALTFKRSDVNDIGRKNSYFSKTIDLPGTINNDKVFEQLWDLSVTDTNIYLNKKCRAIITMGDYTFLDGVGELISVDFKGQENSSKYSMNFYDSLTSLSDTLGDKYIIGNINLYDDIDFSEYNHTFSMAKVMNSWESDSSKFINPSATTSSSVYVGSGYTYPLLQYYPPKTNGYYLSNFFPATYVKEMFDKIISGAGFTYTSSFINSTYFKQLINPYTGLINEDEYELRKRSIKVGLTADLNKNPSNPDRITQEGYYIYSNYNNSIRTFKFPNSPITNSYASSGKFNDEFSFDFFDINGNYSYNSTYKTFVYTTPVTGDYLFSFNMQYGLGIVASSLPSAFYSNKSTATIDITANIIRIRNGIKKTIYTGTSSKNIAGAYFLDPKVNLFILNHTFSSDLLTVSTPSPIKCYSGDIYYIEMVMDTSKAQLYDNNGKLMTQYSYTLLPKRTSVNDASLPGTFFTVKAVSPNALFDGVAVDMNKFLPQKVKQLDYVKDIITMFNLQIDVDPTNPYNLLIEKREDYLYTGDTRNWSHLLDRAQPYTKERIPTLIGKDVKLSYQSDNDVLNTKYRDYFSINYGDYIVQNTSEKADDEYEIKLDVFASTPASNVPNTNIITGQLYDTDSNNNDYSLKAHKPRILFLNKILDYAGSNINTSKKGIVNQITITNDVSGVKHTVSNIFLTATQFDEPYYPIHDLNWGYSYTYWNEFYTANKVPPYDNLYNEFWYDYIQSISSPDATLLTGYFNLNEYEISKLKFNNKINLDGTYWLINAINDWNPNRLTECQLIRLLESTKPTTPSGKTNTTLTLVNVNNVNNLSNKIKVKSEWGALPLSTTSAMPPEDAPAQSVTFPNYSDSGSTIYNTIWSASTAQTVTQQSSIYTPEALGYGTGNNNIVNSNNFILAGNDNFIGSSKNVLVNGDDNQILGANENINIQSSGAFVNHGVNNVAIIGTTLSGNTAINQSNSTIIGGNLILSQRPIQKMIHVISGKPTSIPNRLKNIHVLSGSRSTTSHTLGGPDDVIHIINGNASATSKYRNE